MKALRLALQHALWMITAIAGVGFVCVVALHCASWAAGRAGYYLKPAQHFQIIERERQLWFFSDDWPDAESNPAPDVIDKDPGMPIGRRFEGSALGLEWHYCELPSADRTIWSVRLPTLSTVAFLLAVSATCHLARKRFGMVSYANPPAPTPEPESN